MNKVNVELRGPAIAWIALACLVLSAGSLPAQVGTKITPASAQPRPPVVPVISSVSASAITTDSATITWTTDIPSDSQIDYGTTTRYGSSTTLDPAYTLSHSQALSGLASYTTYHYHVKSSSGLVNLATSADFTFTTLPPAVPPSIVRMTVPDLRATSAVIVWSTSTPSDTQIDYGTTTDYNFSSSYKASLANFHGVRLTGLSSQTTYHYRVRSTDYWGHSMVSSDYTLETGPPAADNVYDLYYPRVALSAGSYTGVALTDLATSPAALQFSAFDQTGIEVNPPTQALSPSQNLGTGAQLPVVDSQIFGAANPDPSQPGWARIRSLGPKAVGFYLTFDGSLTQMDGTFISPSLPLTFVVPEVGSQDYTKIALSNPDLDPATVNIDLVAPDGSVGRTMQTTIQGYGTLFADLYSDLFPGVIPSFFDYVRVSSDKGLIAYEYFGGNGKDFATLAGQDTAAGASTLYSPQYVEGGPWQTTISVVNLGTTGGNVSLSLYGDNGSQIGLTRTLPIAPGGKIHVAGTSFFDEALDSTTPIQGYVVLSGPGLQLSGNVVFGDALSGTFISALPLVSTLQQSLVFSQVASSETYFTGLAIVNPNLVDATARIDLYASDGTLQNSFSQTVRAGRRVSRLLTDYFPALVGQTRLSGYIKVTVDQGVACFGVLGTNNLSVLSAIPAQSVQ